MPGKAMPGKGREGGWSEGRGWGWEGGGRWLWAYGKSKQLGEGLGSMRPIGQSRQCQEAGRQRRPLGYRLPGFSMATHCELILWVQVLCLIRTHPDPGIEFNSAPFVPVWIQIPDFLKSHPCPILWRLTKSSLPSSPASQTKPDLSPTGSALM